MVNEAAASADRPGTPAATIEREIQDFLFHRLS